MASVYADPRARNKRHYIAASSFNTVLYKYTTSLNPQTFVTTGALGAITAPVATTSANCPQGRILREVGNRLYPDAHPGISTMMVQVYDANSGIRGYIDPNAPQFAVFNSDKPVEIVDGGDNNSTTVHKGSPVFTTGDVIAGGDVKVGKQLQYSGATKTIATAASTTTDFDFSLYPNYTFFYFGISGSSNITINATGLPPAGTYVSIICIGDSTGQVVFGTAINGATTSGLANTNSIIVNFISNGSALLEISRSGLLESKLTGTAGVNQVPGGLDA